MKACNRCAEVKWLNEFPLAKTTRDGRYKFCKECRNKQAKEYKQRPEVKAHVKEWSREYYQKSEVKVRVKGYDKEHNQIPEVKAQKKAQKAIYYQIPEVKTRIRGQQKERKQKPEVKALNNERQRERFAKDPLFRFACNMRRRIGLGLKGHAKSKTTEQILGCTFEEAWEIDLIPKFRFPMTRENYGKVWHVDHIRPVCSFDLSDPEQVKACFHHSNLQPLFIEENLSKGGRY
jgi:hypothetical protein